MNIVFYISAAVAIAATGMVVTRASAIHALLYLIVSLLAVALVFFALGAPLIAALEVIIYAGAIMVLFLFVIMMLNLGPQVAAQENNWLNRRGWAGPGLLALILVGELVHVFRQASDMLPGGAALSPEQVGIALFGTYLLGVELASTLLLAGLVGAYHLGRRPRPTEQGEGRNDHGSP